MTESKYGLKAVEVWNEPNLPGFWGFVEPVQQFDPQPARFATLFDVASVEFDAVNLAPGVKLLPGGLSPLPNAGTLADPVRFLRIFRSFVDDPSTVDGLSVHLYANFANRSTGVRNILYREYADLRDVLDETSDFQGLRMWITEIGIPSAHADGKSAKNSSERFQRSRLRDAYHRFGLVNPRIRSFIVHRLVDNPGELPLFGVLTETGGLKFNPPRSGPVPIYCALAKRRLADADYPPPLCVGVD